MKFHVADNSGAKIAKGISVRGMKRFTPRLSSVVRVSIASADPRSSVKKGSKHLAVVLSLRGSNGRDNGTHVRSNKNSVVLLDKDGVKMLGTRVLVPAADEIRDKFADIISKAKEIY